MTQMYNDDFSGEINLAVNGEITGERKLNRSNYLKDLNSRLPGILSTDGGEFDLDRILQK